MDDRPQQYSSGSFMEFTNLLQGEPISAPNWVGQPIYWNASNEGPNYPEQDNLISPSWSATPDPISPLDGTINGYGHSQQTDVHYPSTIISAPTPDSKWPFTVPRSHQYTTQKQRTYSQLPGYPHPPEAKAKTKQTERKSKKNDDKKDPIERTREKNRIAAGKCRGRQRVAVEQLNSQYEKLREANEQLKSMVDSLLRERIVLKNMLVEHGGCRNELIDAYLQDSAARWVMMSGLRAVEMEESRQSSVTS